MLPEPARGVRIDPSPATAAGPGRGATRAGLVYGQHPFFLRAQVLHRRPMVPHVVKKRRELVRQQQEGGSSDEDTGGGFRIPPRTAPVVAASPVELTSAGPISNVASEPKRVFGYGKVGTGPTTSAWSLLALNPRYRRQ